MASEAISSSILLIGAVLGAAVLITAILPAIFSAGDTFGTVSSSAENKMKTDFRIVNSFANVSAVKVWMKNVGANPVSIYDIRKSDVFFGKTTSINRYSYSSTIPNPNDLTFTYSLADSNQYWDPGETLEIAMYYLTIADTEPLSFTFTLPNSIRRSTSFSKTE